MKINQNQIDSFNKRLRRYYHNDSTLVLDGIIDADAYNSAKFKILWILKEPYGDG